ncbi:MAG: hypothetical protein OEY52_05445 [Gammaproteobacteria bacterium]|nr:hypothetical protein [Gammaproteobacteria bacterium]
MKIKFLMMTLGLMAAFSVSSVQASDMNAAEADIKAECKEESKNAESPEIYFEECVADKMQALRDEQGTGSGDAPAGDRG